MKYGFGIIALFLVFYLLYPAAGSAEDARLKKIRVVTGGELKDTHIIRDMRIFVGFVQPDETWEPISTRDAFANDKVFVKPGANLLIKYKKQEAWLNYNTRVRIEPDGVYVEEGELYVLKKGGWFGAGKLALQGLSEYYVKMEADGKTTLYVVKGSVLATDRDTGDEESVSESEAINESLEKIRLPEEEIRRILMWREQLKLPLGLAARIASWAKRYWWTTVVGAAAGIIVKEAFFSPKLHVEVELP